MPQSKFDLAGIYFSSSDSNETSKEDISVSFVEMRTKLSSREGEKGDKESKKIEKWLRDNERENFNNQQTHFEKKNYYFFVFTMKYLYDSSSKISFSNLGCSFATWLILDLH